LIAVAILLIAGLVPALAAIRIAEDGSGHIGPYLTKYRALPASGERIEIDRTRAQAGIMLLGIIPRSARSHLLELFRQSE
jgi:hypothetical protein